MKRKFEQEIDRDLVENSDIGEDTIIRQFVFDFIRGMDLQEVKEIFNIIKIDPESLSCREMLNEKCRINEDREYYLEMLNRLGGRGTILYKAEIDLSIVQLKEEV